MGWKYDPRTGGMVRTKPAPLPADLARAMLAELADEYRRDPGTTPTIAPFDRLPEREKRKWLNAAQVTIRRLNL